MANWKKISLIVADVALAGYLVAAMTAFNKPTPPVDICETVPITVAEGLCEGFLSPQSVKDRLLAAELYPQGQPLMQVNTRQIEEFLESDDLIMQAECYKSQAGHVCIQVKQRIPTLRVMSAAGEDYCIDTDGELFTHRGMVANVLIVTGSITRDYARRVLSKVGLLLASDPFWRQQVVQLNVQTDGSLELVPRAGNHIVYLGQPVGLQKKLDRLQKFYLYGLPEAGWNKYSRISVDIDNQIVCKRRK